MKRALAAVLWILAAASPAYASQVVLVLRARVTDANGHACSGLPIAATSTATAGAMATSTDADGRSLLPLFLGGRNDLQRAPVVIRLRSEAANMHLEARNGAPEIALSFSIPADDTTQLQIITSGGEVGSRIAEAFRGATHDTVEAVVDLRCGRGPGNTGAAINLDFSGRVPLPRLGARGQVPAVASLPPPAVPRRDTVRTGGAVAPPPRSGPSAPPTSGAPVTAPPPSPAPAPVAVRRDTIRTPAIPCDCRLVGTVEVESDRPTEERLRVIVQVREVPSLADTVELYMGSPRPFRIMGLPCGNRHLDVIPLSRRRFRVLAPEQDRAMNCTDGLLIQPRVILAPR